MSNNSITIRTDAETIDRISALASSMDRSRNWVIEAALKHYIQLQGWQVEGIREALNQIDAGDWVSHEEVFDNLRERMRKDAA